MSNTQSNKTKVAPLVDVYESGEEFRLVADLPGVGDDELELSVDKKTLTIASAREGRGWEFGRDFRLPDEVDVERVEASLNAGVLTVTIPKAAKARVRKISVKTA